MATEEPKSAWCPEFIMLIMLMILLFILFGSIIAGMTSYAFYDREMRHIEILNKGTTP